MLGKIFEKRHIDRGCEGVYIAFDVEGCYGKGANVLTVK